MALLSEYAITPDVFDTNCHVSGEVCLLHLYAMREVLFEDGLVRDLHDGEWARLFQTQSRQWHPRSKELIRKLAKRNRMVAHSAAGRSLPSTDIAWCEEALQTHAVTPLRGVIATDATAGSFPGNPLVASVDSLSATEWWTGRSCSLRLTRSLSDYAAALSLVIRHSNSMMFCDPHLDPCAPRYGDFIKLIELTSGRRPMPLIEVHRCCYLGSSSRREVHTESGWWKQRFGDVWGERLARANLSVEVFIWDDFHDRYLISDLIGVSLANGFDTSEAPSQGNRTTWTRMGRGDRDDVQREFDPSAPGHKLHQHFTLP